MHIFKQPIWGIQESSHGLKLCIFLQFISIPVRKGSAEDGNSKFQFNCSSMPAVSNQGYLDCVQQVCGSNDIATLGTITHKINVMATDDSFQTTRVRMKEAEEERKEVR